MEQAMEQTVRPAARTMAVDKNMQILMVDDQRTTMQNLSGLLRRLGFHNLDHAANGDAALEKLRQNHYGLVISECEMQPVSGLHLLRELRADDHLRATPVIMVAAARRAADAQAAVRAGADGVIVKPFDAERLQQQLAGVLGTF